MQEIILLIKNKSMFGEHNPDALYWRTCAELKADVVNLSTCDEFHKYPPQYAFIINCLNSIAAGADKRKTKALFTTLPSLKPQRYKKSQKSHPAKRGINNDLQANFAPAC